ncbi:hypothetical protein PMIN07_011299 [Paraphaeosphaeria minitans]
MSVTVKVKQDAGMKVTVEVKQDTGRWHPFHARQDCSLVEGGSEHSFQSTINASRPRNCSPGVDGAIVLHMPMEESISRCRWQKQESIARLRSSNGRQGPRKTERLMTSQSIDNEYVELETCLGESPPSTCPESIADEHTPLQRIECGVRVFA